MSDTMYENDHILERNMRFSKADAFTFALMVGAGEGYLVAFALEAGMDPVYAGLLATLPLFFGGVLQFFVHRWIERRGNYHRFTYIGSLLQALSFLPFVVFALIRFENFSVFLIVNSFYWLMAFAVSASWNVLMSSIIPFEVRNSFFSKRSTYTYSGMFLGMIFSGIILEHGRKSGHVLDYFSLIFLFSMLTRIVSSLFLKKHSLITEAIKREDSWSLRQWQAFFKERSFKKIMFFVVMFKIPVYLSSPFFVPYMLKEINMDYATFMVVISASLVGKILISRKLDWLASKLSMKNLLLFSGIGIAVIPPLWVVSREVMFLFSLQIFAGMVWGGFEYSFFLIVLNEFHRDDQARFMSIYNFLNATAIITGSLLGAILFSHPPLNIDKYIYIFVLSGIFRSLTLLFFPQLLHKVYKLQRRLILRPLSFRPNQGPVDRPVIVRMKSDDDGK